MNFFEILSLVSSFVITLFVTSYRRSIVILFSLALMLFVLFGPLALPGFFLAMGSRALFLYLLYQKQKVK